MTSSCFRLNPTRKVTRTEYIFRVFLLMLLIFMKFKVIRASETLQLRKVFDVIFFIFHIIAHTEKYKLNKGIISG
jgi:hypothetical protein